MRHYGVRSDMRRFEQNSYGGYCNYIREQGLEPLHYVEFQEIFRIVISEGLTKKQRKQRMIEHTKNKR